MKDLRTLMEGFKKGLKENSDERDTNTDLQNLRDAIINYIEDKQSYIDAKSKVLQAYDEDVNIFFDYLDSDIDGFTYYEPTRHDVEKIMDDLYSKSGDSRFSLSDVETISKSKYVDEVDAQDSLSTLVIYNKYGNTVVVNKDNGKYYASAQGYSTDIDIGEIGNTLKDIATTAKNINKSWMKEYDPQENRW